ncbi:MAG: LPS-assembly protein LptD [Acidobacteria bacterium]|nr:LPS-assembly protein LptD [Acidobacteriota bacterium]
MRNLLTWLGCLALLAPLVAGAQQSPRASVEFERPDGAITIEADRIERTGGQEWRATGSVRVTYKDAILATEALEYNSQTEVVRSATQARFTQGLHWIQASRMEMNLRTELGVFFDAEGFTDQDFYFKAAVVRKTGPGIYQAEDALVTSCSDAIPKWSFSMRSATVTVKESVTARNTLFHLKKLPVLYIPYLRMPLQRKRRASGFLIPSTGTSNNKGRRISQSFYLTLGESADLMLFGDYFSSRGLGYGSRLRARPHSDTRIDLNGYVVRDRLKQGGASMSVQAETLLPNGFRGVALFNLVSNFAFRQVFSDTFRAATAPDQNSLLFLTNNFGSLSFNTSVSREETFFPARGVVIRSAPRIELRSLGTRLGNRFYLEFESTLEGLNRSDALLRTPQFVQRFDLFPRLYYTGLKTRYFSFFPKVGARETYYSDSRDGSGRGLAGKAVRRHYQQAELDLLGPVLQRRFKVWGGLRHSLQPELRYRWIDGIRPYRRLLRFDDVDAVADTHEVEYSLTQRLFRGGNFYNEGDTNLETISFRIAQKYFVDGNFGGALEKGRVNQFYPLNTLTGFLYATEPRRFSPVTALLRFSPSYRYSADVRADYDSQRSRFRNTSVTGYFSASRWFGGITYFLTRKLDPSSFTSNQVQTLIAYGQPWKGFSASSLLNYDIQRSALQNSMTRVNYFWDCCGLSLEFLQFRVNVRNESHLRFSFFLKGLGAFGTMQRPDSIF